MTRLYFTFSSCNVFLGLICVKINGLGSRLHSVDKMGVWRNVVCKLVMHSTLVGNVWGLMIESPKWRRYWPWKTYYVTSHCGSWLNWDMRCLGGRWINIHFGWIYGRAPTPSSSTSSGGLTSTRNGIHTWNRWQQMQVQINNNCTYQPFTQTS